MVVQITFVPKGVISDMRIQVVPYRFIQPMTHISFFNLLHCKILLSCLTTYTVHVKNKKSDEYFKSSSPQPIYRESCYLQTCSHWPVIKMRSLVELTFHLGIRKIRQPDFLKFCSAIQQLSLQIGAPEPFSTYETWQLTSGACIWVSHINNNNPRPQNLTPKN